MQYSLVEVHSFLFNENQSQILNIIKGTDDINSLVVSILTGTDDMPQVYWRSSSQVPYLCLIGTEYPLGYYSPHEGDSLNFRRCVLGLGREGLFT